MRTFILPVCVLAACATADDSDADFSSVDNQSKARLVLVDDGHWQHGDDTWHVDCVTTSPDDMSMNVDHDELVISGDSSDCDVSIVVTGVDSVTMSGDGDVDADETLEIDHLDLYARGNGQIHVDDLQSVQLSVDLSGTGDVWIAGATDNADISIQGNGALNAGDLWIEDLTIDMTGSGDATVRVTGTIAGEVGGSGSLEVLGDPDGDVSTSGSGEVVWL